MVVLGPKQNGFGKIVRQREMNAHFSIGSGTACFPAGMMKHVMTSGAAAVAFAASALIALPASADSPPVRAAIATDLGDNSALFIEVGHGGYDYRPAAYSYRGATHGYTPNYRDRMSREAIQACRKGIRQEARRMGFRDVDFDSRAWAQPFGRGGYTVRFREVEFEGRRHDFERGVSCTVRRGRVTDIQGVPHRGGGPRYDGRRNRW
jgi:hypothetical protein